MEAIMADEPAHGEPEFRRPDPVAAGRALAYAEIRRVVSRMGDEPITRAVMLGILAGVEAGDHSPGPWAAP
jgi:hypothetical protein